MPPAQLATLSPDAVWTACWSEINIRVTLRETLLIGYVTAALAVWSTAPWVVPVLGAALALAIAHHEFVIRHVVLYLLELEEAGHFGEKSIVSKAHYAARRQINVVRFIAQTVLFVAAGAAATWRCYDTQERASLVILLALCSVFSAAVLFFVSLTRWREGSASERLPLATNTG